MHEAWQRIADEESGRTIQSVLKMPQRRPDASGKGIELTRKAELAIMVEFPMIEGTTISGNKSD